MYDFRTESKILTIDAPITTVWSALTDLGRARETLSHVVEARLLTPGPFAKGTRWSEVRRWAGRTAARTMTVDVVGREEYVASGTIGSTRCRLAYHLHPLGSTRTTVIVNLHFEGSSHLASSRRRRVPRWLGPEAVFTRLLGRDLVALARAART